MRFVHALAFVLLGLGGCTTQAETEMTRMQSTYDQGVVEMTACATKLEAMPSYLALKDKLPPNKLAENAPMELLTNTSKPNPEEAVLLLDLHKEGYAPCRRRTVEIMTQVNPALAMPGASYYAKTDALYARLVKREISWGEYASSINQERATYRAEYQQAFAKVSGDLNRSHNEETQRKADAMRGAAAAINASRPRTTYCTGVAPYITCTTY
jgi:hypothetical protein